MRENGMFKVGDKVHNQTWGEGHVVFGPFQTPTDTTGYLVEDQRGKHFAASEGQLETVHRFEVGQVVRTSGILCKVIAGPFTRSTDSRFYVLEGPDGSQDIEFEDLMVPIVE